MTTPPYPGQDPYQAPTGGQPDYGGQYQPPGQQYQPPGQQYQPSGQYGQYPQPGYGAYPGQTGLPAVPPKPPVPGSITGALSIFVLAAVSAVVSLILITNSPIWEQALHDATAGINTTGDLTASQAIKVAKYVAIGAGVIISALYLLFAYKMYAGRNWARIVLTVLTGLTVISQLTQRSVSVNGRVYSSSDGITGVVGWITVVLAVLAIVLMYLSPSNHYFSAMKARKQAGLR